MQAHKHLFLHHRYRLSSRRFWYLGICLLGSMACSQPPPIALPQGLVSLSGAPMVVDGYGAVTQWDAEGKNPKMLYSPDKDTVFTQVLADRKHIFIQKPKEIAFVGNDGSVESYLHSGPDLVAASLSVQGHFFLLDKRGILEEWQQGQKQRNIPLAFNTTKQTIALAAFSQNAQRVITVTSGDTVAQVWDPSTGKRLATLGGDSFTSGHTEFISAMALSPDGTRVVTGGHDGFAFLWNVSDVTLPFQLGQCNAGNPIVSVDVSPDSNKFAVADEQGNVIIQKGLTYTFASSTFETFNRWRTISLGSEEKVSSVLFSLDSGRMAVVTATKNFRIFQTDADQSSLWVVNGTGLGVSALGDLFFMTRNAETEFWKTADLGSNRFSVPPPILTLPTVSRVVVSSDSRLAITPNDKLSTRRTVWDISANAPKQVAVFDDFGGTNNYLGPWFWPNRPYAVSEVNNMLGKPCDAIVFWDLTKIRAPFDLDNAVPRAGQILCSESGDQTSLVDQIVFSQDGQWIFPIRNRSQRITLYKYAQDITLPEDKAVIDAPAGSFGRPAQIVGAAFSSDSSRVVFLTEDGLAQVWDLTVPATPHLRLSWYPYGMKNLFTSARLQWTSDDKLLLFGVTSNVDLFQSTTGMHVSTLLANESTESQGASVLPNGSGILSLMKFKTHTELRLWKMPPTSPEIVVSF